METLYTIDNYIENNWNWKTEEPSGPKTNIFENKEGVTVILEVPGVNEDDIKISVENNVLTVSGGTKLGDMGDKDFSTSEIDISPFERRFILSDAVDTDTFVAKYKDGMLILLALVKEEAKAKDIKITV